MYVQIVQMRVKGVLNMVVVYNLYGSVRWSGLSLCHFFSCPSFISEKRSGRSRQISPLKVDDTNVMLSHEYFKYDQESARWWCRATISRCWWLPHPGETRLKIYHAAVSLPMTSPHTKTWSRIKGRLAIWGGSEIFVSMSYSTRSWWNAMSKSQKN